MKSTRSRSLFEKLLIQVIRLYQHAHPILEGVIISVFGVVIGCKHSPTCSEFTIRQIEEHGTIRGLLRGGKRILSCW